MRRRGLLPHSRLGFGVLTGIVGLMAGSTQSWSQLAHPWEEARARELLAAHSEGIPTRLEDLDEKQTPADQNAATYLSMLHDLDKSSPVTRAQIDAIDTVYSQVEPTPDLLAATRAALQAHQERLRLIHLAAHCKTYHVPLQKRVGLGITIDEFPRSGQFREMARWLLAEGAVLLADGRPQEAILVDGEAFLLARLVSSGSMISYLVGAAVDSIALGAMRVILYRAGADAAVADSVRDTIRLQRDPMDIATALVRTVVLEVATTDAMRADIPMQVRGETGDGSPARPFVKTAEYRAWTKKFGYPTDPVLAISRMLDMNDAHYISWMRRIITLSRLPYPEARAGIKAIVRAADKLSSDPDFSLAAVRIGNSDMLVANRAKQEAVAESVEVGAAVIRWKDHHGSFPDTLDECMNQVPLDPFDLRPMRYRKEGDGFVVYSVGATGKFDGDTGRKKTPNQTVFRFPPAQSPTN